MYEALLDRAAADHPRLIDSLRRAHDLRSTRVGALMGNDRFAGLDELLSHLDKLVQAFSNVDVLTRLTILVERARADVQTAI